MNLMVDHHSGTGCTVMKLMGRFIEDETDQSLLSAIHDALQSDCHKFIIDLEGLSHINSSGINMLVKTVKLINGHGGRSVFIAVPPKIEELLEIIKLNAVFEIAPDFDAGLNALMIYEG